MSANKKDQQVILSTHVHVLIKNAPQNAVSLSCEQVQILTNLSQPLLLLLVLSQENTNSHS